MASPGCTNTTQKSTGKREISLGEKWKNHDDVSRLGDVIHANPLLLAKKLARQALNWIEEERDEEERKNRTMNPMPEGMDILIDEINEEEDIGVLTAWTEEMEDKIWINAKLLT